MEFDDDKEILIYVIQDCFRGRIDKLEESNIIQFKDFNIFKNEMNVIETLFNQIQSEKENLNLNSKESFLKINGDKEKDNNKKEEKINVVKKRNNRSISEIKIKNENKEKENKEKKIRKKIYKSVPKKIKINNNEIEVKNEEDNIHKINRNIKRNSKNINLYNIKKIELDRKLNIRKITPNNLKENNKKFVKKKIERKQSITNLSFKKEEEKNKPRILTRNKSQKIRKTISEKMDENLKSIIIKNGKDSLLDQVNYPENFYKKNSSINQLKEEFTFNQKINEIKEPISVNISHSEQKEEEILDNYISENKLLTENSNDNQNNKSKKFKKIHDNKINNKSKREIYNTELSTQNDNSLNDLINNYAPSTSENNCSINSNNTPIKNYNNKYKNFLHNSNSTINHLTEFPINYRENNIYEHINIIKKYFKLTKVQTLEQNFLKISSFLKEDEQFIFSKLCKPLIMRYIVNIGQNMEKEILHYNNLIKKLKEKFSKEEMEKPTSLDFMYNKDFIKAFELLNKSHYIELFRSRIPLPNNKILIVYMIFITIVRNYRSDIFYCLNNKDKFWNKLSEFFVRESFDGEYFGDLIKFLLIKQSDFSLENILNLKQLSENYSKILFPVNYSKENPTTAIFVFLIRELLEFCGAIDTDKTSPFHKNSLYNYYIKELNKKINKLGMLIIKLKLKNKTN